jgi:biotin/methionine sulfoxide reductase
MAKDTEQRLTSSHWGIGVVDIDKGRIKGVKGHPSDPDPSPLNENIAGSLNGPTRVLRPAIRSSWLEGKKGERGRDSFVEVSWEEALDKIAQDLTRVRDTHGNEAIFAGSYGWASAGRFHHAQSQLKRFLNTLGGFVRTDGNYSYNAALFAMPHIVGGSFRNHLVEATRWPVIAKHSDLVVAFGGLAMRNTQICDGGNSRHRVAGYLQDCADAGVRFVNFSPLRSDTAEMLGARWMAPRPGTDTAVMMGLAHTLIVEDLHDQAFLARYCTGFDKVAAYLMGKDDGIPKTAEWAAEISGLDANSLRDLAREMAAGRTMISCAVSLQRADWGEQPLWMCVTLAAMLGQIGLPGGGYTIGYAANGHVGTVARPFHWTAFDQGKNPIKEFLPVAMISDMLLNPGANYRFEGETKTYPDARLVWWAGGNPFHHHQDLNRLREAFQSPETIIVNEINWTATARHADIVLPVAAAQERTDFGAGRTDNILVPMPQLVPPPGEARQEYDIYCALAKRLGTLEAMSEGRDAEGWLRHLWVDMQRQATQHGETLPNWDDFIAGGIVELTDPAPNQVFLSEFRANPDANPRQTPSGKIELFSKTVAAFDVPGFQGHATWKLPRDQAAGTHPLALISGQPATRLHSQHDNGALSMSHKIAGREPVLIHLSDAQERGIETGDIVELFNHRGRCLAGAQVTDDVMRGVVFLWTGAWYDPDFDAEQHRDRHGNPNVLTHDLRTSEFTQGPASHSAYIELRKLEGDPGPVMAHQPPL